MKGFLRNIKIAPPTMNLYAPSKVVPKNTGVEIPLDNKSTEPKKLLKTVAKNAIMPGFNG